MAKRKAAIPKSDGNGGVEKKRDDFVQKADLSDEELHELFDKAGINKDTILIPSVYKEIFLDNYRYFLLSSGRVSGKTSILVAMWWLYSNKYPDRDIVILQATATEIKDSIINEIEKFLCNSGYEVADNPTAEFYIPRAHDHIERAGYRGQTFFYPITDSKGGQRSRGINTKNKLSLVLYEEAQKTATLTLSNSRSLRLFDNSINKRNLSSSETAKRRDIGSSITPMIKSKTPNGAISMQIAMIFGTCLTSKRGITLRTSRRSTR